MNKVIYHFVRLFAKYTSPILSILESHQIDQPEPKHHPIYIIGAPRSGSTLLYQLITNNNELLYIDNFINLFYRNLSVGFSLSNRFFNKKKPHNSFNSNLGNTLKEGWRAPNESGNFWYQWVDKSNDYDRNNNLSERKISKIRGLLFHIMTQFDKPIIFKNLNNSQRLPLLSKIDPKSKVIWIKRDPLYTAQSIIEARRKLGIASNKFWSVKPKGLEKGKFNDEFELVVNQVNLIESRIEEDLRLFDKSNVLKVNYLSMKDDLSKILQFCDITADPTNEMLNNMNLQNTRKISAADWNKLVGEYNKINN